VVSKAFKRNWCSFDFWGGILLLWSQKHPDGPWRDRLTGW